jgi:hypothetical protein
MMARADFDGALAAICEHGVLLETDRAFPSLVALVAGGPVKGTWWAHPLANEIYMLGQRLMDHRDVLFIRLVSGKMTYVHRRLWRPALRNRDGASTLATRGFAKDRKVDAPNGRPRWRSSHGRDSDVAYREGTGR